MLQMLGLLCYGLVLLFGTALSVCFSGVEQNRKNLVITACFFFCALLMQIISLQLFGLERTKEIYPLIVHLPLVIFLTVLLKRSWLVSLSSVFSAYLCCQIPNWVGLMSELIFPSQFAYYLSYIPAIALCYLVLQKHVATPASKIMAQSKKSCLLFGVVPLLYYIFDYISTIYTNWLYSGAKVAVQFIPAVVSVFYFVFILVYYDETQKEKQTRWERNMLAEELKQAKAKFDALSQMQEQTRRYRHDMRHHFALLQGLAAKRDIEKIICYLQTAEADLAAFTPVRYCENETVNLLLSFFETKAKQAGVVLSTEVSLPKVLSISDTELCSLLSNSLENAITAVGAISSSKQRVVSARITVYKGKLLLYIENPYEGDVLLKEGLPQAKRIDHGYGTRSISAIAELHGGQALFSANAGVFSLKVMIPLKQ